MSPRYHEAFRFAADLHGRQTRKGVGIPYLTHLMSVSALVLEFGGDEDQAIAGLLHDSIEDQAKAFGGADRLRHEIANRFGGEVLRIVEACTDADVDPKPPWKPRKVAYLRHLASVDTRIALVSCCDKLHNARSVVTDIQLGGQAVFERFSAPKSDTLWYYRALSDCYLRHHTIAPAPVFRAAVDEMHRLAR